MNWQRVSKDLIILTLILSVLFGTTLGVFPLHTPDAARYAEIPREMLATGDYITPHLNGLEYFEKPPLFYWMQAINIKFFGVNVFAANLANAVMALLTCLVVYLAANKLYGARNGFIAAIVLGTSILFFAMDHVTTIDMTLTFFLTSALLCFIMGANAPPGKTKKSYTLATFVAIALAIMTKGLVGIVLPGAIVFLWLLICNKWQNIKTWSIAGGVLLLLLIAGPWHILVQLRHPEFFHFYFIEQHFLRYLTDYAGRMQSWWFFPVVLIAGFYPWITFLLQAVKFHLPHNRQEWQQHKTSIFFVIWAVFIFIFYSFSSSRLIPYLLPIFPALAIMVGNYFSVYWEEKHKAAFTVGFSIFAIVNILLGVAILQFPHFMALPNDFWLVTTAFLLSILFIAGGIITFFSYRCWGVAKGFVTLATVMIILFVSSTPLIHVFAPKTTMPFAIYLKPRLHSQDEVVSFHSYYQDLPYYLERRITVVDYTGELAFGSIHEKNPVWMINQKTFWQRWFNKSRMYMIIDKQDYDNLSEALKEKTYPLVKYKDKILVTNTP